MKSLKRFEEAGKIELSAILSLLYYSKELTSIHCKSN